MTQRYKIHLLLTIAITTFAFSLAAQTLTLDLSKVLKEKKYTIFQRNVSALKDGKRSGVKLDENSREGLFWLNGVVFRQGIIEVDLRGRDVQGKSFVGIAFHGENDSTYDAIYFRPFNFHTTDPVRKIHAVQYISHPVYTWKKLRDERNGVFEKEIVSAPDPNGWFHARIEVNGKTIKVYVDNATTPSLIVEKLNDRETGSVGLWVGDGSDGDFSNLKITNR